MSKEREKEDWWWGELSDFIVEANKNTWAADIPEVKPQRPGYQELEYQRGDWLLRDSYTGYFRAPGMTTVYYKNIPVWTQAYGGRGMVEGHYEKAKATFQFLKTALMKVTPNMPFRGPREYVQGNFKYIFDLIKGDIADCLWQEEITENGILTFSQVGFAGLVLPRDKNRNVKYPWNL